MVRHTTLFVLVLSWLCICPAVSSGQVAVVFDDGSRVTARDVILKADSCKLFHPQAILTPDGKSELYTAGRDKLVSIELQKTASSEQWDKIRESTAATDRIVVDREGHLDFYAGTIPEISSGKVFFRPASSDPTAKTFELNREKIVGVVFAKGTERMSVTTAATSEPVDRTGEILQLTNGDVLHSVLEAAKETNGRIPWKLANGLTGLVAIDKIKTRQSRTNNTVSLVSIEPTTIQALPLGLTTPAITTHRPDWKNSGIYRKQSQTQARLAPPCLVIWPIPQNAVRIEGELSLANITSSGAPSPELKITVRNGESVVFRQSLDARQPRIPFSIPLTSGTKLGCQVEFQRGPVPGGLVELSGNFITASPRKSR